MAKKLHYFNLNGLAESIRYLLHYGGQKFEDVHYDYSSWPIKEVKDTLPFGQLPLYTEGTRSLNQSIAIARYIAHQVGLLPSDPWEQAVLDSIVFTIYDFWAKVLEYIKEHDTAKKAAIKKVLLEETVEFFFTRFEKTLRDNNGFFSGKLSWADFIMVAIVESANLFLGAHIEERYPQIKALIQKIKCLPGVKTYLATRKEYKALGESIRYLLHYGGVKFEDVQYDYSSWPIKEVKDPLPFGKLPLYTEGTRSLNQSIAIARYIALQVGLLPSDPWEQAVLDAAVLNIYDFWGNRCPAILGYLRENDTIKKEAIKKVILESVEFYFSKFEKSLCDNNGFFSGKLSWADFILVGIVDSANLFLGTQIEDRYPYIKSLMQKIKSLPRIKNYIATRKEYHKL